MAKTGLGEWTITILLAGSTLVLVVITALVVVASVIEWVNAAWIVWKWRRRT